MKYYEKTENYRTETGLDALKNPPRTPEELLKEGYEVKTTETPSRGKN